MRVLIFHGYLLRGTGSNVYTAKLAQALRHLGHEVHVLCQDRHPRDLPWVDAVGTWRDGGFEIAVRREPVRATVYRPDIGSLLPVYVADRYEGVDARPFPACSDAEIGEYVARNVEAVRAVIERAPPDVALAGYLVMGPAILARAGLRPAVKV
ncbi:MAG: glycosyltransferase [Solirubrobacterales bacterium]